tara:strand:- start:676 stop:1644 length:969 start_codon:yes stop_codon:yes gene_type:complete
MRGEKVNIYILIKTFLSGFSSKKYFENYINAIEPEFCITFSDNSKIFYELELKKKIKKIAIQNSWRNPQDDSFLSIKKELNKKLYCDYLFVFNEEIGKKYSNIIESKILTVGSFKSNCTLLKNNEKSKYDLLYISSYNDGNKLVNNTDMTVSTYHRHQPDLLKGINSYVTSYDKKLFVYGKKEDPNEVINEDKYFKKYLLKNYIYIKNDRLKSIEIIDDSSIILTINSTLGYEALSRGKKVIFFDILPKVGKAKYTKFGWPYDYGSEGLFWTNKFDENSVLNIINKVEKLSFSEWNEKVAQISSSLMKKDLDNSKFNRIIGN